MKHTRRMKHTKDTKDTMHARGSVCSSARMLTRILAFAVFGLLCGLRAGAQDTAFVQWANAGNIVGISTYLDNPILNDNPKATLMVTPSINPYNQGGVVNKHYTGVWYDNAKKRWAIFNEDLAAMPVGAAFNVWAYKNNGPTDFVQQATAANTAGKYTYINSPYTNGNPYAVLYVTELYNPYGYGGTLDNAPIGAFYDSARKQWAIMNTVSIAMPLNAAFFVFVDKIYLHKATLANTVGARTLLDDAWSLPNYYALTFITANVTPNGVPANLDPNPTGVWWINGPNRWSVVNLNGAIMPLNNAFNVKQEYAH